MTATKIKVSALLLCFILISGCGKATRSTSDITSSKSAAVDIPAALSASEMEADNGNIYTQVMSADYIEAADAAEKLSAADDTDPDAAALLDTLSKLEQCGGRFVQESQDADTIYTADITFYLKKGQIYCAVDYTNYMGSLDDSEVAPSDKTDYLFEAHPLGHLGKNTHDFQIYFGTEQMYISWGTSCEHTLTRSDTPAGASNPRKPFEETSLYETLDSALDKNLEGLAHTIWHDEESDCVKIAVEVPGEEGNLRKALDSKNQDGVEAWNDFIGLIGGYAERLTEAIRVGDGARHLDLYMVDRLNSANEYSQADYLAWIQDGTVVYNYADLIDDSYTAASERAAATPKGVETPQAIATTGEKNALSKARDYLDFTAFSYSGLIEQLEFEGFTHSEAVYGADNCGADWYEQAALKAADYLDFTSFSRSGLIEQLEFEGFSYEQAVYGVEQNGY